MLRTNQKDKTFGDIVPFLNEIEKQYFDQFLIKENLTLKALVVKNGGMFVLAVLNNQLSLASKLLKAGANLYEKVGNQSFLSYAAERGKDDIVSFLIQHGADRFLADENEKALLCAIAHKRTTTVKLLLNHRPYDPVKDKLILIECAKWNQRDYLKKFLKLASHSEQCLITALEGAIQFGSYDTTQFLLENLNESCILQAIVNINLATCDEKISRLLSKNLNLLVTPAIRANVTYSLKDINEVDAIDALYRLAEKSSIGQQQRNYAIRSTVNTDGLYEPLSKCNIENQIKCAMRDHAGRIGPLGYLQDIGISFQNKNEEKMIDITTFLETFKIPHSIVITELNKLRIKTVECSSNKNNIFDIDKDVKNNQTEINTVTNNGNEITLISEKLTLLLNGRCKLIEMYDCYVTDLPDKPFELLKKYADMLTETGLKIKLKPASSLCGGLVKVASKLEFYDSLPVILTGLNKTMSIASSIVDKLISNMKH